MRHIMSFSADLLLRLTSQKTGIYVPNLLWREKCHYSYISNAALKIKKLWPNLQIY